MKAQHHPWPTSLHTAAGAAAGGKGAGQAAEKAADHLHADDMTEPPVEVDPLMAAYSGMVRKG